MFKRNKKTTCWQTQLKQGNQLSLPQKQKNCHNTHPKKTVFNWYDDLLLLAIFISNRLPNSTPVLDGGSDETTWATLAYPWSKPPLHSEQLKPRFRFPSFRDALPTGKDEIASPKKFLCFCWKCCTKPFKGWIVPEKTLLQVLGKMQVSLANWLRWCGSIFRHHQQ